MKTNHICPICGTHFTRIWTPRPNHAPPVYCSRACSNKAPGRMSPDIRAKISREGPEHPNWNGGEWLQKGSKGNLYMRVWIPPEYRHLYPNCVKGFAPRSHVVWNQAHPDDPVKIGEIIHHVDGDSLNDVPDNLQKYSSQRQHASFHAIPLAKNRLRDDKGRFI